MSDERVISELPVDGVYEVVDVGAYDGRFIRSDSRIQEKRGNIGSNIESILEGIIKIKN